MNQRLIYVLKDAVECRCRPNIDDIDAQNILFSIEEIAHLRAKVAELEAKLAKYQNLEPVAWVGEIAEGVELYLNRNDFVGRCIPLYALEK